MKRGHFYILVSDGKGGKTTRRRDGYIFDSGNNVYGIDNRGDSRRPCWIVSDICTGNTVTGRTFTTRKAAAESITDRLESIVMAELAKPAHDEEKRIISAAYQAEPEAPKAEKPREIKSRTYNNFCKVWEAIQKKGYPAEEAAEITRRIFDDYEQNPAGLPISGRIDLIGNRTTYFIMYYYQNGTKRAEIRKAPAILYIDVPAAGIEDDKREIRRHDPGAVFSDEIGRPYIFRTFTGWTVYDTITAERIIYAANDQEAEAIARAAAAGRAYTCNIMETGKTGPEDTTPEAQERPTTDGDGQTDTDTTSEPERAGESPRTDGNTTDGETAARTDEEPPRGTETATNTEETASTPEEATRTTTGEQPRPESIQTQITTEGSTEGQTQITTPGKAADDQSTPGQTTITDTTTGRRETTERQTTITPDGIQTTITTQGTTTSHTTTRGSPTSAQTAPQRRATTTGGQATTKRAKSPPRPRREAATRTGGQRDRCFFRRDQKTAEKSDPGSAMNIPCG